MQRTEATRIRSLFGFSGKIEHVWRDDRIAGGAAREDEVDDDDSDSESDGDGDCELVFDSDCDSIANLDEFSDNKEEEEASGEVNSEGMDQDKLLVDGLDGGNLQPLAKAAIAALEKSQNSSTQEEFDYVSLWIQHPDHAPSLSSE